MGKEVNFQLIEKVYYIVFFCGAFFTQLLPLKITVADTPQMIGLFNSIITWTIGFSLTIFMIMIKDQKDFNKHKDRVRFIFTLLLVSLALLIMSNIHFVQFYNVDALRYQLLSIIIAEFNFVYIGILLTSQKSPDAFIISVVP